MIKINGEKWIHFGEIGYEDYTLHKDDERRKKFITRNKKWSEQKYNTAGFLSYFLLW